MFKIIFLDVFNNLTKGFYMEKFKKEIIQFGSFVLAMALIFAIKYGKTVFATSTTIHAQNMMHTGWNDAKKDLRKTFEKNLVGIDLPEATKNKYLDCAVEKAVGFLNQTVCSYHYNKMTTSVEEHLKQQDECIRTSGYASAMEKYFEACADETIAMNQNVTEK
jgi:hypothetical protein